ncbi:hypothetical protein E6W39_03415 [Kitasatospora acidiphila]|uniref:Translation elongation factor EFG/EF2 domain-containing protein n=1 Tax=Kitasatospora acidiphila TaxID=2567942 RepID=A0A540VXH3_9ACTN|nr:hypothetical protein [Kitasatospora acidiphila]TQF01466.1 hypothetical protein E6W39_03415 [Kitasatospora acidiphila]
MNTEPRTFPPRPIRGLRARFVRQFSCPSDFADVTVDFEPWEDGFTFEVDREATVVNDPGPRELAAYHAALAAGMREELAELAESASGGGLVVAVAVVVRRTVVHDVDSHAGAFHRAGRLVVREAFDQAYGGPSRPERRRAAPSR